MNIHKFFPVQEPQPEELDEAFLDAATNLIGRFSTIMQPGIVPAGAMYSITGDTRYNLLGEFAMTYDPLATPGTDAACTLNIGPGMAFGRNAINDPTESPCDFNNAVDLKLERIFISPAAPVTYNAANPTAVDTLGNALPKSTGSYGIILNPLVGGVRQPSITYYLYVTHLLVVDTVSPNPPGPGDKYTINPISGQVSYTHWVDGYQVKVLETPSVDANDVYLGTVTCTNMGITTVDTSTRQLAYIPASIIRSKISSDLLPASYQYDSYVSLAEHINAVGDVNLVSPANPHGTTVSAAGMTSQGPYADTPENFHVNGITDHLSAAPGPFYTTASSTVFAVAASLVTPVSGQALYIYGKGYTPLSHYWSEALNGSSVLELQELFLSGTPVLRVDFPTGIRDAGYYYIYGERYVPVDPDLTGLALKAMWVGNTGGIFTQMVEDPSFFLTPQQYPFAVCQFDGAQFTVLTDPQTGFTDLTYKMIDMRNFGTIGSAQLNTNKRYYAAGATAAQRDIFNIEHIVTATKFEGNGAVPVGAMLDFAGLVAPVGYKLCDNTSLSKLDPVNMPLFDVIGYLYGGSGDNFNVPDSRRRVTVGSGSGLTTGQTGGEESHTLTALESGMRSHTHSYSMTTNSNGPCSGATVARHYDSYSSPSNTSDADISGASGSAHNNMQPYLVATKIIKY